MRTQDQNPAHQRYAKLLPKNGLYPAQYVDIFWNITDDGKSKDVEAAFIPRGSKSLPNVAQDSEFWARYEVYIKKWESDLGNSCDDWLTPGGQTPESVFARLASAGFASADEFERTIEEFAHIDECAWARDFLQCLRQAQLAAPPVVA